MDQKQLERLLDSMGISYTHTATKPTQQLHPSRGRYTMTGDWIEEEYSPQVEPVGVRVDAIPDESKICDHCGYVVDKQPVIHIQCKVNRFKSTDWKIKCKDCKKEIEFKDFKQSLKSVDK
jgi:hypothetical protein